MRNFHKTLIRINAPTDKLALLCGMDEHAILKIIAGDTPPTPRLLAILELLRSARPPYREKAYSQIAAETWRPIPGYDGYEASNLGSIRRKRSFRNMDHYRVVKPNRREDGYLRVTVWRMGKKLHSHVHRLVCLAFHGEPFGEAQLACHDDGDRTNNTEDNLYWGTAAENYADQVRHGTARLLPGVKAKRPLVIAAPKPPKRRHARRDAPHKTRPAAKRLQNADQATVGRPQDLTGIKLKRYYKNKMLARLAALDAA